MYTRHPFLQFLLYILTRFTVFGFNSYNSLQSVLLITERHYSFGAYS